MTTKFDSFDASVAEDFVRSRRWARNTTLTIHIAFIDESSAGYSSLQGERIAEQDSAAWVELLADTPEQLQAYVVRVDPLAGGDAPIWPARVPFPREIAQLEVGRPMSAVEGLGIYNALRSWGRAPSATPSKLAIDVSGSMTRDDLEPGITRLRELLDGASWVYEERPFNHELWLKAILSK